MAWFREWFGEEYLELYSHHGPEEAESHVAFVERVLPAGPRAVLDLACGAGRHAAALRRRGIPAVGVDLSLRLLGLHPGWARAAGDMRVLPFQAGSFDWVLNFFTSFGYFETERENFRVIEEVVRVLAGGGWFLIDFLNVDAALESLRSRETVELGGREVELKRWYDPETRRLNKRIRVREAGDVVRSFLESVRAYRADEVVTGLRWAGLEVVDLYGSFAGEPYGKDSERLILVGRKAA